MNATHRLAWFVVSALLAGASQTAPLNVSIHVTESANPLSCRIHLHGPGNRPVRAANLPFFRDHFACPGAAELKLDPGDYHIEIERGPEYSSVSTNFTATEGRLSFELKRITHLSREGWWSGDLHVHRPLADIPLLMRSEDLHIAPVITWWNQQNPWTNRPLPNPPLIRFDENRFYHALAGEDERGGGALLYYHLHQPLSITGAQREFPSPMRFLLEAKQDPAAWADIEKPFWWDAPTWLASGKADSIGLANNHMCRSSMYESEAWGRPRDTNRLAAPRGNGFWTQEIYYHILNSGLRIPPSAGSASGVLPNPPGYNRVYVHLEGEWSYEQWWEGLRAGRSFVSNGPLLRCRANGKLPGQVFRSDEAIELSIETLLDSRDRVEHLEIIRNGVVAERVPVNGLSSKTSASLRFDQSGWFLVRAITEVPHTFRFASTAPFFVEIGDRPSRISRASAQFFLDWVRERMTRLNLTDPAQRREVLGFHEQAEKFWAERVAAANAE